MPIRAICSETCRGICPECGVNSNTTVCRCAADKSDSRWAALKDFPFK